MKTRGVEDTARLFEAFGWPTRARAGPFLSLAIFIEWHDTFFCLSPLHHSFCLTFFLHCRVVGRLVVLLIVSLHRQELDATSNCLLFYYAIFFFLLPSLASMGSQPLFAPPPHFCSHCVEKPNGERNVRTSPTEVYTCLCTCVFVCVWGGGEGEKGRGPCLRSSTCNIRFLFFTMEFLSRLTTNSFLCLCVLPCFTLAFPLSPSL